eukprot:scaffold43974_cov29-Prasinocladus_malaysianus.AAC.1
MTTQRRRGSGRCIERFARHYVNLVSNSSSRGEYSIDDVDKAVAVLRCAGSQGFPSTTTTSYALLIHESAIDVIPIMASDAIHFEARTSVASEQRGRLLAHASVKVVDSV